MTKQYVSIPSPPEKFLVGNLLEIEPKASSTSFLKLARKYGEIYSLQGFGITIISINSAALVAEACEDDRFRKLIESALIEMRQATKNGLLTADTSDPKWHSAHRIAMPGFTPVKIREMFDGMKDIVSQLCLKWARMGSSHSVDINVDFTRMALDIIGLCGMGYRFNTFYDESKPHPVAIKIRSFLEEVNARCWRIPFTNSLHFMKARQFNKDIEYMRDLAQDVINHRRKTPGTQPDILDALLDGVDPETGEKMNDATVIDNLLTLIGAGHETTSGALSLTLHFLLQHPAVLLKAQQELDRVIGKDGLKVEHLSKLPYIDAILRETLRFYPVVPLFSRTCDEDQILGGKYLIKKDAVIIINLRAAQRDPEVYGDDADEWKPERMLGENFKKLPAGAWKPFGTGIRACIGRSFAWQESQIALAMILHTFNFELIDPDYTLKCRDAITLNPINCVVHPILRSHDRYATLLREHASKEDLLKRDLKEGAAARNGHTVKSISVFYGSDQGNAESLAHFFASHATGLGYEVTVNSLNAAKENLPRDRPVIIIASSYNGEPPVTAAHFVKWLQSLLGDEIKDVSYAVFGCGHKDWSRTFQRIPTLIDDLMAKHGGARITPLSSTDASLGDVLSDFQDWEEEKLWPALLRNNSEDHKKPIVKGQSKLIIPGLLTPQQTYSTAYVTDNRLLTNGRTSKKMHMEVNLPNNVSYSVGDYIVIAPVNPHALVARVFLRFTITWDTELKIDAAPGKENHGTKHLANDILSNNVELSNAASSRNIRYLATLTDDEPIKETLNRLIEDNNQQELTVLDILEDHPSINITIEQFLSILPPLRVRTYSISSSPLHTPNKATITYSVVINTKTRAKVNNNHNEATKARTIEQPGIASNYLANLNQGSLLRHEIQSPRTNFTLPTNQKTTPIIMICAGSGIAPFRGFIQERHELIRSRSGLDNNKSNDLASAILFFGSRTPTHDDLYRDELDEWEHNGAVTIYRAYSRATDTGIPRKYVQDILIDHATAIRDLWGSGARCYVCGGSGMAEDVKKKFEDIIGSAVGEEDIKNDRYLVEIYS